METFIRFWTYLNSPDTFVPGITGFMIGLTVGLFLGKPMWDFLAEGRRFKREDREAERQRKEEAAKRRLEACERRKNEKREVHAILWDRNGTPYCPVCGRALKPFVKDQTRKHSVSYCYGCRTHMICDTLTLEEEVRKKWER